MNDLTPQLLLDNEALFLTSPINIRYLTGFSGLSPTEREAYLLVTSQQWHLFTFDLYREEAELVTKTNPDLEVHIITPNHRLSKYLGEILAESNFSRLGFEQNSIHYKEYMDLKQVFSTINFVPDTGTVEKLRTWKSSQEITSLKRAIQLTDECFSYIQTQVNADSSEAELAWYIERYFREHHAQIAFNPIVAFNTHSSIPHHVSQADCKLQEPSIILLDFGGKVEGYHGDMTRMLFWKKPREEWIKAYTAVLNAQQKAIEYVDSANPNGAIADKIARETITQAGFPTYPHSLGHGVGLEIHEDPRLSIHRETVLEEHMVFSVEPGTYLPGQFGIRIEDLVLKTKTGVEVLSKSLKEIIVLG